MASVHSLRHLAVIRTRLRRANRRYALGIGQIQPKVGQFGPQLTQISHPLAHIVVTPSLNTFGPIGVVVGRRRRPRQIGSNDDFIGIDHWYQAQNTTSSDPYRILTRSMRPPAQRSPRSRPSNGASL